MTFVVSNGSKEVRITLGYDFVTDLPGTKELQSALRAYLTAVALRFPEQDFSAYATLSGAPFRFQIEFPFRRSTEGGSFEFVHVLTASGFDTLVEAKFSVHLSDFASLEIVSLEHVITERHVVNAVRQFIDDKKAVFYPQGKHPVELQVVTIDRSQYDRTAKSFVYYKATDDEIASFLRGKVYWLGFRQGNQNTSVCIADPYDSAYLGVSSERLQQAAAILAAVGFIQLDSSGLYANAGTKLLQEAHRLDQQRARFLGTESLQVGDIQLPPTTAATADGVLSDVFISHATEDKAYVEPLVKALEAAGIAVWFDKSSLEWGDDLRTAIDRGLRNCRYGIVLFSKAFLGKKKWTEYELNSLFAREQSGNKLILPIWHGITRDDLIQYSPAFADRIAKLSSADGYTDIVGSLLAMLGRERPQECGEATIPDSGAKEIIRTKFKANAVAFARYETTGQNAARAEAYVRPSTEEDGRFTFENSLGEEKHGTKEEIAQHFVAFDKSLRVKHYIRVQHGSADPAFSL